MIQIVISPTYESLYHTFPIIPHHSPSFPILSSPLAKQGVPSSVDPSVARAHWRGSERWLGKPIQRRKCTEPGGEALVVPRPTGNAGLVCKRTVIRGMHACADVMRVCHIPKSSKDKRVRTAPSVFSGSYLCIHSTVVVRLLSYSRVKQRLGVCIYCGHESLSYSRVKQRQGVCIFCCHESLSCSRIKQRFVEGTYALLS